jgi:xanthine dehydrogenase accessory factor
MTIAAQPARRLGDLVIAIKGAGEMASAIACRLHRSRMRRLVMLELAAPIAVRRQASFAEAVYDGCQQIENIEAVCVGGVGDLDDAWRRDRIAVLVDPAWGSLAALAPDVVVDAILAKRNLGTTIRDGPLVVALGPGFAAGVDAHVVVGTNRGPNLGRVFVEGTDEPDTGIPASVNGFGVERVLRAPCAGVFQPCVGIGTKVGRGQVVATVNGAAVATAIDGVVRGLLRPGILVRPGLKVGDVDPRRQFSDCAVISDKGRAIAGGVLEAILSRFNR